MIFYCIIFPFLFGFVYVCGGRVTRYSSAKGYLS